MPIQLVSCDRRAMASNNSSIEFSRETICLLLICCSWHLFDSKVFPGELKDVFHKLRTFVGGEICWDSGWDGLVTKKQIAICVDDVLFFQILVEISNVCLPWVISTDFLEFSLAKSQRFPKRQVRSNLMAEIGVKDVCVDLFFIFDAAGAMSDCSI